MTYKDFDKDFEEYAKKAQSEYKPPRRHQAPYRWRQKALNEHYSKILGQDANDKDLRNALQEADIFFPTNQSYYNKKWIPYGNKWRTNVDRIYNEWKRNKEMNQDVLDYNVPGLLPKEAYQSDINDYNVPDNALSLDPQAEVFNPTVDNTKGWYWNEDDAAKAMELIDNPEEAQIVNDVINGEEDATQLDYVVDNEDEQKVADELKMEYNEGESDNNPGIEPKPENKTENKNIGGWKPFQEKKIPEGFKRTENEHTIYTKNGQKIVPKGSLVNAKGDIYDDTTGEIIKNEKKTPEDENKKDDSAFMKALGNELSGAFTNKIANTIFDYQ